jgi:hypothetical protein
MTSMRYLTGASILALRESKSLEESIACNCHFSLEWDSVEFGAGKSETVG